MDGNSLKEIKALTRQRLALVWEMAQHTRVGPDRETTQLIKALKQHREYHHIWDRLSEYGDEDIEIDGVNPILHIYIHGVVENQLAGNDPPFVAEAVRELMQNGIDRHSAIHAVGAALAEQIYSMLSAKREYDAAEYQADVQRCVAEWLEHATQTGELTGPAAGSRRKKKRARRTRKRHGS